MRAPATETDDSRCTAYCHLHRIAPQQRAARDISVASRQPMRETPRRDQLRRIDDRHAHRLRYPSGPRGYQDDAAALPRRSLEGAGHEPRHRRARPHQLPAEHAAVVPARLAAEEGQARQQLRDAEGPGARRLRRRRTPSATSSTARRPCSTPTWRPPSAAPSTTGSRRNGWRAIPACAPRSSCRCRRRTSAVEEIERLAGDQRFVCDPGAGPGRDAARPAPLLAGLPGGRAPQAAARHPLGQPVPHGAELHRLAVLSARVLHRRGAGPSGAAPEPHPRGRVRQVPRAQGGADGSRASAGCRPSCGAPTRPGRACASRCPGSTARPPTSCAIMCASRSSRSTPRPTRPASSSSSSRSARTGCCCFRATIRTGSSTATSRCRRACRRASSSACAPTIRSKHFRA